MLKQHYYILLRSKYPQFIDVCKVVEIWWDLSCQSISIKPTVAIWNSFNSIECKERRYNEEKVIVEKG
jgi:hypothetical protein